MRPQTAERAQPRPALGLRPWFAFLRRALRLRRLDFAIGPEGNSRPLLYRIGGPGWRVTAAVAGPTGRLRGLRPVAGPLAMLLRTRSVHTAGMREPLVVAAIAGDGTVRRVAHVAPGRLFADRRAAWILEFGPVHGVPTPGDRLTLRPMLVGWPGR